MRRRRTRENDRVIQHASRVTHFDFKKHSLVLISLKMAVSTSMVSAKAARVTRCPSAKAARKSRPAVRASRSPALKVFANKWKGLDEDISDDQQDITRGRNMVDAKFQGAHIGVGGTHNAVMQSYDYISQGLKSYSMDNIMDDLYISPSFMDKVVVHLAKNFMELPKIKNSSHLGCMGRQRSRQDFPV